MTQIIHSSNGGGGKDEKATWGKINGNILDQTDLVEELDKKPDASELGTTAFSNDYNDLDNQPTIGGGVLTIKQNSNTKATFNANATTNATAEIVVPTKVSELQNDANYLTSYTETDPTVPSHVKGITEANITSWNGKYAKPSGGIPKTDLASAVQTSLGKADTAVQPATLNSYATTQALNDGLDGKQDKALVTTLDNADDTHYPSAKAVADAMSGAGLGDMLKSVYDPTNKNGDAFDAQKHHNLDTALSLTSEQAVQNKVITAKINDIELSKSPNVSIVGTPTIVNGNISNFSTSNYLIAPFLSSFAGYPFTFHMDVTTGTDITTQQNIIDAEYGMAFAIKNGKFVIALSTNGTSWDLGEHTGTYTVKANTSYCVEIAWDNDRTKYTVKYSLDRINYYTDITVNSSSALSGNTLYLGGHGITDHPFKGTFNFNERQFLSGNVVAWKGMDDAGLATRANLSLSNLNAQGEERLNNLVDNYFLKEDEDYTVEYDATKGVAPYSTSYGYTNITITNPLIKEKLGATYQFSINTKPATSTYRNVRVRFGEDGERYGLGAYNSVAAQYSYFTKAYPCFFVFKENSATATTSKYFSGVFVNTTYSAMTAAEATTGTATSGRTISAKVLNDKITERLTEKQDVISDLADIRAGAELGATALQSFTETDPTVPSHVKNITETNISNWNGKYAKPTNGIPKSDLDSGVQASLGKADTALQGFTESDPTVPSYVKSITQTNITSWNNAVQPSGLKTINGESIVGSGDIEIKGGGIESTTITNEEVVNELPATPQATTLYFVLE